MIEMVMDLVSLYKTSSGFVTGNCMVGRHII